MLFSNLFNVLLALFIFENTRTFALSTHTPSIRVWDNTLPSKTLSILNKQASQRGLGHHIFRRTKIQNDQETVLQSPIEQALDDLLTK